MLVGAPLQWNWMKQTRREGTTDYAEGTLADRLSRFLLHKWGVTDAEKQDWSEQGVEQIICNGCDGLGRLLDDQGRYQPCPLCHGVGFGVIRRFGPNEHLCSFCAGMGRAILPDSGTADTCPRCDGRGLVRIEPLPDETVATEPPDETVAAPDAE